MKTQEFNEVSGWSPTREELNDYLRGQQLCVIATIDATGAPQGATVSFSVAKTGELLIGTSERSRKITNVRGNDRVALTVTDAEKRYTAQIQSKARVLSHEEFIETYADEHYAQRPESLPFKDLPGQAHIAIVPTFVRFSDCNPHPWVITEFNKGGAQ